MLLLSLLILLLTPGHSAPAEDRPAKQADYARLSHSPALPVYAKTTVEAAVPLSRM